ncbi:MAG TPA: phospholipase [Thermoanaerobaculia bacterium]
MKTYHVATNVHGRFLHESRDPARLLVGFHGYAETAEMHMAELQQIPGAGEWSLAAVQALHPFYIRGESQVVANWMTRQDRELAIADNLDYVRRAVAALPRPETLIFLGFSQGAQMAYRAAADFAWRCHGLIILGGDVPPDVAQEHVQLPPTLVARGKRDEWFTDEKLTKDLRFLKGATRVESLTLDAGHEWTAEFREAAGQFLATMSSRA